MADRKLALRGSVVDLNDPRAAGLIQRFVDRRIESYVRNQLPQYHYGVVDGEPNTTTRTVAVRLFGLPMASPGFVYGTVAPRDGDHVRVFVHPRGDRYVDGILGRDVVSEIVDVVTPPATPIDRALAAIARIQTGSAGAPAEVTNHGGSLNSGFVWDFDWTATAGRVIVAFYARRDGGGPANPPAGYTLLENEPTNFGGFSDGLAIYAKVAAGGEDSIDWSSGGGVPVSLDWSYFVEVSNVSLAGHVADKAVTQTPALEVALSPVGGVPGVLLALLNLAQDANWSPEPVLTGATFTELIDAATTDSAHPQLFVLAAEEAALASNYDLDATYGTNPFGHRWYLLAVALAGAVSDDMWVLAPQAIDGDDPSYETSGLAEAIRIDLLAAYRIVRARLVIACEDAGAKTYSIRGANEADFSDEATLDSRSFTSAGAFDDQEVLFLWSTSTSYRYFRLVGPAEARRIHTIELYEAAGGEVIVTDPTTDEFAEIDAALAALNAAIEALGPHPDLAAHDALGLATQAELDALAAAAAAADAAHEGDATDAHDASAVSVADAGGHYTGGDAEAVFAEIAGMISAGGIPATIVDAKGDLIVASAADTVARLASSGAADGDVLTKDAAETLGMKWATPTGPGGGGNVSGQAGDTVEILGLSGSADRTPASPNAADDEFETTDATDPMTGWTTLGTPTQHDMNTTIKSHYYLRKAAATLGLHGIYKACPSFPFTVTAKVADYTVVGGNARASLFVAEATPGKLLSVGFSGNSQNPGLVIADIWTNRTTYGSTPVAAVPEPGTKYLRMVVTSSTAVQCYFSLDGRVWWTFGASINPSMTIGSVGLMVDPHTSGQDAQLACDWIRFT